jgi:tetratricopeptide (TPR) repeat protein
MILSLLINVKVVGENIKTILTVASIFVLILFAGITIQRNTNWYNGLTLFSHDIKGQENVYEIQYNYGYALMQAQQYDEAIVHFQKALSLFPHSPVVLGNLCYSYLHGNKLNLAKNCFINLLQKDSSAGNYAPLILVYLLQDNPDEAKKTAQTALNKWPNDGLLWKGLGLTEYKLNDMKSAQSSFEKSYTLLPDKTTAYYLDQIKNGQPIEMTC